jgi:hypothetical protein
VHSSASWLILINYGHDSARGFAARSKTVCRLCDCKHLNINAAGETPNINQRILNFKIFIIPGERRPLREALPRESIGRCNQGPAIRWF